MVRQSPSRRSDQATRARPPGETATSGLIPISGESFRRGPSAPVLDTRRATTCESCCQTTAASPSSSTSTSGQADEVPSGDRVRIGPMAPPWGMNRAWTWW